MAKRKNNAADEHYRTFLPSNLIRRVEGLVECKPESLKALEAFIELLEEDETARFRLSERVQTPVRDNPWVPVVGRTSAGVIHFWDERGLVSPDKASETIDEKVRRFRRLKVHRMSEGRLRDDKEVSVPVSAKAALVQIRQPAASEHWGETAEFIESDFIYDSYPDAFAMRIDGDSMSPRINDGEIVIVSASKPAVEGRAGLVRLAGQIGTTCKIFRTIQNSVHLIPINEKYNETVVAKDKILWALEVLSLVRFE